MLKISGGQPWGLLEAEGQPLLALTLVLSLTPLMNYKNGHKTGFYKAKRRIDDMNLHKKRGEFS